MEPAAPALNSPTPAPALNSPTPAPVQDLPENIQKIISLALLSDQTLQAAEADFIHRWSNLHLGKHFFQVIIIVKDNVLWAVINGSDNTNKFVGRYPREVTEPSYRDYFKTCEVVIEIEGPRFFPPIVDWFPDSEQVLKVRCLRGLKKIYWQIFNPLQDVRTYLPFTATTASEQCSSATKEAIEQLKAKSFETLLKELPLYKCVQIQHRKAIVIEPLHAPSFFDPGIKVTSLTWGTTLITFGERESHCVVCVEGINDGFINQLTKVKNAIQFQRGVPFKLIFYFTGVEIVINLVDSFRFIQRTEVKLLPAANVKNMLLEVHQGTVPQFNLLGQDSWFGKGQHNDFTWAREMVRIAGWELAKTWTGLIISRVSQFTLPPQQHPKREEKL